MPRLCGFPSPSCRRLRLGCRLRTSLRASPSFRVLPSNTYPTAAAIGSSHGLRLPTAHARIRGSLFAGLKLPASFRLQGLATLLTAYSLESRAGFVSHRQRSWDSPFGGSRPGGTPAFRRRSNPPTVWPHRFFQTAEAGGSASEAAVPGSMPSGSASRPSGVLSRRSPAPPLGFAPLGPTCGNLDLDFSRPPLTRFTGSGDCSPNPSAPQSLDRLPTRTARCRAETRTGRCHPCGVPAPA